MDAAEWASLWMPIWKHITSRESWLFVSQVLQGFGQALAVLVAFYALWTVQKYTKGKDKADFIRNRWNEQAQTNIACLINEEVLRTHEEIVYGLPVADLKESRKFFVIFCILNQIQHLHIAYRLNILKVGEFEAFAIQTLKLIKREQTTVIHLLSQRGYTKDFSDAVIPLFDKVVAPELPAFLEKPPTSSQL